MEELTIWEQHTATLYKVSRGLPLQGSPWVWEVTPVSLRTPAAALA